VGHLQNDALYVARCEHKVRVGIVIERHGKGENGHWCAMCRSIDWGDRGGWQPPMGLVRLAQTIEAELGGPTS
jgi:hypothetical protein